MTAPRPLGPESLPEGYVADAARGERLYHAGGCISCHKPAETLAGVDPSVPAGGSPLATPIGTLYPSNITPDRKTGIGGWSDLDFLNAVKRGLSPAGSHYIPAFPYASYAAMPAGDILDIRAYLMGLAPVNSPPLPSSLPFEPLLRRGVGMWKLLGLRTAEWRPDPARDEEWNRGAYLVNGPGHCGECHTPRNLFMVADVSQALAGGPHPEGKGKVPSLRDLIGRGRYQSREQIAEALQYGELFGYDRLSSGGMAAVQRNIAKLPEADIRAIAAYLASLK
jgi:mono/diheme cytochrome c family protein